MEQNKKPLISETSETELDPELEFDMCFGCWRYFRFRK